MIPCCLLYLFKRFFQGMPFLARNNWRPFRPWRAGPFGPSPHTIAALQSTSCYIRQTRPEIQCHSALSKPSVVPPPISFSHALRGLNADERDHLAFHGGTCVRWICGIYTRALPAGFVSTQYLLIGSNCLKLQRQTARQRQVPPFLFLFSALFQSK